MAALCPGQVAQGDPSDCSSSLDLLALATQSRSPSDAVRACDRILSLDPGHLPALEVKVKALWRMGRFEETLECLDEVLRLNPFDPAYHFLRGDCLQGLLRYGEALAVFERCASAASGNLRKQALMRVKGLHGWQATLAAELACSDAAFGRLVQRDPVAAMESLGFAVSSRAVQPKRAAVPSVWARPS